MHEVESPVPFRLRTTGLRKVSLTIVRVKEIVRAEALTINAQSPQKEHSMIGRVKEIGRAEAFTKKGTKYTNGASEHRTLVAES